MTLLRRASEATNANADYETKSQPPEPTIPKALLEDDPMYKLLYANNLWDSRAWESDNPNVLPQASQEDLLLLTEEIANWKRAYMRLSARPDLDPDLDHIEALVSTVLLDTHAKNPRMSRIFEGVEEVSKAYAVAAADSPKTFGWMMLTRMLFGSAAWESSMVGHVELYSDNRYVRYVLAKWVRILEVALAKALREGAPATKPSLLALFFTEKPTAEAMTLSTARLCTLVFKLSKSLFELSPGFGPEWITSHTQTIADGREADKHNACALTLITAAETQTLASVLNMNYLDPAYRDAHSVLINTDRIFTKTNRAMSLYASVLFSTRRGRAYMYIGDAQGAFIAQPEHVLVSIINSRHVLASIRQAAERVKSCTRQTHKVTTCKFLDDLWPSHGLSMTNALSRQNARTPTALYTCGRRPKAPESLPKYIYTLAIKERAQIQIPAFLVVDAYMLPALLFPTHPKTRQAMHRFYGLDELDLLKNYGPLANTFKDLSTKSAQNALGAWFNVSLHHSLTPGNRDSFSSRLWPAGVVDIGEYHRGDKESPDPGKDPETGTETENGAKPVSPLDLFVKFNLRPSALMLEALYEQSIKESIEES